MACITLILIRNPAQRNPTNKPKYCKGQNVTFIGEGPGKTTWYIGTPWSDAGGETNGDYSFDGANSATFQNMTLKASMAQNEKEEFKFVDNRDWTGFIRINHTIVKDCVIEGRTAYWGYQSSEFINTVFNASKEKYGYALWYYTGTKCRSTTAHLTSMRLEIRSTFRIEEAALRIRSF